MQPDRKRTGAKAAAMLSEFLSPTNAQIWGIAVALLILTGLVLSIG